MKAFIHSLFKWNVQNKHIIIGIFKFCYFIACIGLLIVAYFVAQKEYIIGIYSTALMAAQIAIVFFCISITPGILRRFSIRGSLISFLMLYRRQLGISTFIFAFYHYAAINLFPILFAGQPFVLFLPLFELFGIFSLFAMSLLFFTSNNWSVKKFGRWWSRIHTLIYLIAWTIFLHVFLQGISFWSLLIGSFAILETISLVYFYTRKHHANKKAHHHTHHIS
ncbi:hypothetical protein BH09PAT2_BH09PAT2_04260 [soil metagenome]